MRPPDRYLAPWILQIIGIVLLIAFAVFWALTGRQSELLVGAAGALILLGGYDRAVQQLKDTLKRPPGPGDPP